MSFSPAIPVDVLRRHAWRRGRGTSRYFRFAARCICLIALLLLAAMIGAYVYWTDPTRVKNLAETFLARVIDGDITIGHAKLSIFEGLELDDVHIALRPSAASATAGMRNAPQTIISAKRLQISYSTLALLRGRLESGRVIAIEPEVYLVEDVASGRWSVQSLFQRPSRPRATSTAPTAPSRPPQLPEVLIRGALIHRAQVTPNGTYEPLQTVLLEGQLLPRENRGAYQFNLQSRTDQGTAGPAFQGEFSLAEGVAKSSLTNVDLAFLEPMLPARVRGFWRKLTPTGRVDVPVLSVSRSPVNPDGSPSTQGAGFRIELKLNDVNMSVRPTDWASAREQAVLGNATDVARSLQRLPHGSLIATAAQLQPRLRSNGVVPLQHVQGRFVFTERGVTLDALSASVDGNRFDITGSLGGYSFDSAVKLTVDSPKGQPVELHESVPYMNALPPEIREVYYRFRPRGRSNLHFEIGREHGGAPLGAQGSIEFANAEFEFEQFRYPIRNASGRLVVDVDENNEPRLRIDDVRGNGPANGPNANGLLHVNGYIAPLIGYAAVSVDVSGNDIHGDPVLIGALPPEASQVIDSFDDDGPAGPHPQFEGDFICRVRREPGQISHWSYDTDVAVRHGYGSLRDFAYPLEDFSADIHVRRDYVEFVNAKTTHGGGTIELSGVSEWGSRLATTQPATQSATQPLVRPVGQPGVRTSLTVNAHNVPIDDALKRALPADARAALDRFGLAGRVDIRGPVSVLDPQHPEFDLAIDAHDGRFAPNDWKTSIDALAATIHLTPTGLTIDRASGKRGEAAVTATGKVDWTDPAGTTMAIDASATSLAIDQSLHDSLPTDARAVWDSLKPTGTTDASLLMSGPVNTPIWSIELRPGGGASVTPDFLPIPATQLKGVVRANANRVDLTNLSGNIAGGSATISGVGELGERQAWQLAFKTAGTKVDPSLERVLPSALGKTLLDNAVAGTADLDVRQLAWTRSPDGKSTDTLFDATVAMRDATWTAGATVDKANGSLALRGHFIDDDPASLDGSATFPTLRIAGLDATDGAATIASDAQQRSIQLRDVHAKIGDGEVAGNLTLDRRRSDLTRWQADFLLRNANVADLLTSGSATTSADGNAPKVNGRMNASLSIEGAYGDTPRAAAAFPRRGRGDISVSGDNMLHVPMVLGVTQVVSLALPFTGGFNDATASYSLDGDRVRFGEINLQSNEMRIKGTGFIDFGTKQLSLDFVTDTTGKKLPVIGSLLDAARRELLQIKVRGTVSDPEVKTGTLHTITTTIDEIVNGDTASK